MKKNYLSCSGWDIYSLKKILLTMRISVFILIVNLLSLQAVTFSQNNDLDVKFEETSLKDVIQYIENNSGFRFVYNEKSLEGKYVTLRDKNIDVQELLKKSLDNTENTFRILDNNLIVIASFNKLQEILIKGVVSDVSGTPLPGVNIVEKGTTNGAVTNLEGQYSISISSPDAILSFSYVGYLTEDVEVAGQTTVNLTMIEDIQSLDEVVVIGYGSVKKSDLTGSVGSVEADLLAKTTLVDAAGSLQGRVAGVNIEKNVGRPGSGYQITIRGLSSINNSNSPLYVIDGIPTTSGLTDLNPNDIEKIDILKDASATAIYGSRGANGVVIVSTKKGKSGKSSVQFDSNIGFRTPTNLPNIMNGPEYVQFRTDYYENTGQSTDPSNLTFLTPEERGHIANGEYVDWVDLVLRNGLQYSNTVTLSGGDEKGTFALSLGQLKEEGTTEGQEYNRYNLRLNVTRDINDKWETGGNLYFTHSVQDIGSYEAIRSAYRYVPIANRYDENGDDQFLWRNFWVTNPVFEDREDGEKREQRRYRAFGNIFLQFEPIKGLALRSQLAPQMIFKRDGYSNGQWCKSGAGNINNTRGEYSTTDNFGYVLDNQITYNKEVAHHRLNMSIIQSVEYEQWETSKQSSLGFPYNSMWYNLDAAGLSAVTASETNFESKSLASFTGRMQYGFSDKYLITATARYDGSSRLSVDNKWAFFPSAAAAWRISNESFMQSIDKLDNLKLRISYGVTGNDAVDIYGTQSNTTLMYYDFGGDIISANYKNRLANSDLTWEKTTEVNLGIDYGLFRYRISGGIDIYRRDARDLIMERQIPQTTGWTSVFDNVGWVRNTGIELSLNTRNIQTSNFSWSTDIIFDTNKNEIVELNDGKKDDVGNKWFIGEPIKTNYDYEFDGIWQLDEADEAAIYDQTPGQVKVKDINNDDVIDENDRTIIGQQTPKWSGSITNTITFKGFDFSFNVYTRQGEQLYSSFVASFMQYNSPDLKQIAGYWTPENPSNTLPQPGNAGKYFNASRYQDMSFVRVGNISLGYNVPKTVLNKINFNELRFYVTATNPFLFTDYEGYDPEWGDQNTWGEATSYSTYLFGVKIVL